MYSAVTKQLIVFSAVATTLAQSLNREVFVGDTNARMQIEVHASADVVAFGDGDTLSELLQAVRQTADRALEARTLQVDTKQFSGDFATVPPFTEEHQLSGEFCSVKYILNDEVTTRYRIGVSIGRLAEDLTFSFEELMENLHDALAEALQGYLHGYVSVNPTERGKCTKKFRASPPHAFERDMILQENPAGIGRQTECRGGFFEGFPGKFCRHVTSYRYRIKGSKPVYKLPQSFVVLLRDTEPGFTANGAPQGQDVMSFTLAEIRGPSGASEVKKAEYKDRPLPREGDAFDEFCLATGLALTFLGLVPGFGLAAALGSVNIALTCFLAAEVPSSVVSALAAARDASAGL